MERPNVETTVKPDGTVEYKYLGECENEKQRLMEKLVGWAPGSVLRFNHTNVELGAKAMENEKVASYLEGRLTDGNSSESTSDAVGSPSHYTSGDIEVIDYIKDKLTPEQFQGFCLGNVIKYTSRYRLKNGLEDLKKAEVYLNWMMESMESQDNK